MYFEVELIIDRVLTAAGEIPREGIVEVYEGEWEGMTLRRRIRDALPGVAAALIRDAPASWLEDLRQLPRDISWRGDGSGRGWILLPDDWLRLAVFRMSDWQCGVVEALEATPDLLVRQHGPWPGLRGNPRSPMCLVSKRSYGCVLEFFSSRDDSACVADAAYVAYPAITDADTVAVPSRLLPDVVDRLATMIVSGES